MTREEALEARYRQLLWAYPKRYRRERGAEIVGTLMEAAHANQQRPTAREVTTLAVRGLQTRAGTHGAPSADRGLRGALRLAVLLLLAYATAGPLVDSGHIIPRIIADRAVLYPVELVQPLVTVVVACAVVAVAAGRYVWGLLATLSALAFTLAVLQLALSYDTVTHDVIFPPFELTRDMAAEEPATWLLAFAALLILPLIRRPVRHTRRPALWLLGVPVCAVLLPTHWNVTGELQPGTMLAVIAGFLMWVAVDARATVAAGLLLIPLILLALSLNGLDQATWLWTLLIGTGTLVTTGAVGLHRQAQL
ncbi:hypothetical protein Ais01nite_00470 [Asanoa ishikariensis]|uniref:Uncharacterized protein n=1 Tax=Asanoa ishikariensis TaxID=137265 RepID=A0A1H3TSD7_9ACTN|nr:hypothetical protein [Asanoa ishikariensis]GIF62012.1 hypothetical protein Ais01nite_00470 [Asanoa ishikariensis]SDZ52249.1 hypothetical protein SAMN05421684_6176 [Asanoa ishikariensis]